MIIAETDVDNDNVVISFDNDKGISQVILVVQEKDTRFNIIAMSREETHAFQINKGA